MKIKGSDPLARMQVAAHEYTYTLRLKSLFLAKQGFGFDNNPNLHDRKYYMAKVIGGITISLDGFVNDRDGGVDILYREFEALVASDMLQDSMKTTGAVVMGRNAYEMGQGDYSDYEYQVPIFVLTHQPPETVAKGENGNLSFTFVSDGVEYAVAQAKAAAGDKDVMVIGGASTLRQCLNAGLLDEFQLGIAPVLLGDGLPLFEQGMTPTRLEKVDTISLPGGRTDIILRVVK